MELDTGAAVTLMSESTCRQLWPGRPLQLCTMRLHTYSGEQLPVVGQLEVVVECGEQSATLPLYVVQCKGSSILGRDWLSHLRLDWKEIHQLHQLQHDDPLERMLAQHQVVFQEGLGILCGYKAEIYVNEGARPKLCKAQTYSLRVKVEEELDREVKEGILEPVQFAKWAAPIAPEEKAKALVVINTHRGLYKYNRLPFGVASAPGIFQRVMEGLYLQESQE